MTKNLDAHLDELQEKINEQTLEDFGPEVYKRWKEPGHMGRMEDYHSKARLTGSCGDSVEIYLKFEKDRIVEASFFSDGCGPSVVCGSVACELALGRNLEDAASVDGRDILRILKGLPEDKEHCAFLAARALQEAVHNYLQES
ncbi:MAG: iron-sulfur cluster assembly scaffold protein [Desulfonatronovibrio sp.]